MLARRSVRPCSHLQVMPPVAGDRRSPLPFLHDPVPDGLRRALEGNQRQWLLRLARYGGELIHRERGVVWHDRPDGAGEIQVPFPRFDVGRGGEQLDVLIARLGQRTPPRPARLWLPDPPRPTDPFPFPSAGVRASLPVRLLARGFRPGFRPRWMRLDLWRLRDVRWGPDGLWVERVGASDVWRRFAHPYHGEGRKTEPAIRAAEAAARALPDHVVPLVAWYGGRPVGAATLHLTGGPLGIAGIYDLGVLPAFRNRGIGKALAAEACKTAWAMGCAIAGVNATPLGEPVYRRLGFEFAGEGQTWELPTQVLADAPRPELVAFAEAIGRGDVARLDALLEGLPGGAADAPLACGLTPLALAARFRQATAAEWLVARGATLDLLSAWDLGWVDRAVRLLAERPELADAADAAGARPLHEAARRNDVELACLLLAAGADPAIRDGTFGGTPLDWARHFGHAEVAGLIREASGAGLSD